ncbi:Ig-like domain-containing protein [Kluyvera intermedia]|uniref:Ig-like domain-containing protein n=1 Tax=Kluyvera intermedia TaxID=61648 RepID=UPI00352637C7
MIKENNPEAIIDALVFDPNNVPADGTSPITITARVTDGKENPISGQVVMFSATNGADIIPQAVSGVDGSAVSIITSTTPGESNVTASINNSEQTVIVTFASDTSAKINYIESTADKAVADGESENVVHAQVINDKGELLSGQSVIFKADNNAIITSPAVSQENGIATTSLTSTTPGLSKVTATINESSDYTYVTFVESDSNNPAAKIGFINVVANAAEADGKDTNIVEVQVTDGEITLSGQSVSFSATNDASIDTPVVSGQNGVATTTIWSLKPGNSNITASINESTQTVSVVFTEPDGNDPTARINFIYPSSSEAIANGTDIITLTVQVVDGDGYPLPKQQVTFEATNGANIISPAITDDSGLATTTITSNTPSQSEVSASINSSSKSVNITFTEGSANNPDAIISFLTKISEGDAIADGVDTAEVASQVTDSEGKVLSGQSVTFSADNGAQIISPAITNESGIVTTTLTNTSEGTVSVMASINNSSQKTDVTFVPGEGNNPDAVIVSLGFTEDNAPADGISTNAVVAIVSDTQGVPLPGQKVTFTASNGAIIADSVTSGSGGITPTTLTSTVSGLSTVTASINDSLMSVDVHFS